MDESPQEDSNLGCLAVHGAQSVEGHADVETCDQGEVRGRGDGKEGKGGRNGVKEAKG